MKKIAWFTGLATTLIPFAAMAQDYTTEETVSPADAAAATAAATGILGIGAVMLIIWCIVGLAVFIFWIWTLIDCIRRQFTNPSDKTLWIVLIIILGVLGSILYLIIGRGKGTIPGTSAPVQK